MTHEAATQQLALGTAQFGLDYGITNRAGRVPDGAARALLERLRARGWTLLDTAGGYGNSEEKVGNLIREVVPAAWKVMTKTPAARTPAFGMGELGKFKEALRRSQDRLTAGPDTTKLHALLVHHADDLLVPGAELLHEWLCDLRDAGEVSHIGVSVYDASQIEALFSRHGTRGRPFDIVQLPASIADQRLVAHPMLAELHGAGVQIHARSIYLQGLLLAPAAYVEQRFPGKGAWMDRFLKLCAKQGMSPLQACVSFFKSNPVLDAAVIGMTSVDEFSQLADAWDTSTPVDWSALADNDAGWVDPRSWKST